MNKKYRIRKNNEFKNVITIGQKILTKYFNIYYVEKNSLINNLRFGITISKKIEKLAVVRNKIKRQIKEIIIKNQFLKTLEKKDIVILVKRDFLNLSYEEKEKLLIKELNKLKVKNEN